MYMTLRQRGEFARLSRDQKGKESTRVGPPRLCRLRVRVLLRH